ncbi:hypothetical protein [Thioalkalivibrio sp. ALMg9]|uniref:hypothetical protein n=1 Tax=Thioalkalivibrio sp. ALMg9 TaxID=1266912 RepID=UPI0003747912|nr:hypothetical protein [Thioalkalivibrio sp. ALMg9]
MTIDPERVRRENIRWHGILTLNHARPEGAWEEQVLAVTQAVYPDATALEVRRALDYLHARGLATVERLPEGRWYATLTRHGIDMAEYTIDADPGLGRPAKYW